MTSLYSRKLAPLMIGMFAAWMCVGCGGQETIQGEPDVILTTAAELNGPDIDAFTRSIKLSSCTFVIAAGMATFTPSDELAQVFYGDSHGSAHQQTFGVPVLQSGSAKISLTHLNAEMANTGLTLTGSTAIVKLSFDGLLHVSVTVPILGNLSTDIQVNPSSISVTLGYDKPSERAQASKVTSQLALQAKNCGAFGWCNHAIDNVLHSQLLTWAEVPLRDAITKGLDSAATTAQLNNLLVAGYNLKDPQTTPWTMVAHTLDIASGAFHFTAQRSSP